LDQTQKDIRALVRLFEQSDWDDLRVETRDLKLVISKNSNAPGLTVAENVPRARAPLSSNPDTVEVAEPVAKEKVTEIPDGAVAVTAPNLGTFWRAPKPGAAAYIEVGQKVDADTTVCLIEVMKLFTPISAGVSGTIIDVVAENSAMVEFGDMLVLIDPNT
jgi:acetyl-CoA carboxylase biotin carboxyl carrier protein